MKKLAAIFVLISLLTGCVLQNREMDRFLALRAKLLQSNGCSFEAMITADYGKEYYQFGLSCVADAKGNLSFTVREPETIAGITGQISSEGGKLTFDDKALAFELLADGQLSPISAPWVLMKTLRGGYVDATGMDGEYLRATVHDSYRDDALELDIWLDAHDVPIRAEIMYADRKILSIEVKNLEFL